MATPDRVAAALEEAKRRSQISKEKAAYAQGQVGLPDDMSLAGVFAQPPRELRGETLATAQPDDWRTSFSNTLGAGINAVSGKSAGETARDTQNMMSIGDFVPIVGDVQGAGDVVSDVQRGDYLGAGLSAAAVAMPFVGSKALKKAVGRGEDLARDFSGTGVERAAADVATEPFAFAKEGKKISAPAAPEEWSPVSSTLAEATVPPDPRAGAYQATPQPPPIGHNQPNVDAAWGTDRPDVVFEGVQPHQFSPSQWYRFGEAHGARTPLGPQDEEAWYNSLQPFTSADGTKTFHIPGGLDDKTPFTYFDDLFMKSQAINPAELDQATRTAIHNRTVAGKAEPPGGWQDKDIVNQFQLGMSSPNNPLTPNEFAVAASHVKGPEDIKSLAESSGLDYGKSSNYLGTKSEPVKGTEGTPYTGGDRGRASAEVMNRTGTQAGERGGMGVGGSADWSRVADMAQMMREKPEFFRFRGAKEGGATHEENWANFVDRIITQVPGLKAKTGSFSGVWQDPAGAGISALDRHMLAIIRDNVFETPAEAAKWNKSTIKKWNDSVKKFNADPENIKTKTTRAPIKSIDDLATTPGGTDYFNDEMFATINNPARTKIRNVKGEVRPEVPAHLHPDVAGYVKEPTHVLQISPGYKRGLADVTKKGARPGSTGLFSDQWYQWDPQRQRFEPHEIMNPGLADVPGFSRGQQQRALQAHKEAGYLNYTKDEKGKLQPVRPVLAEPGVDATKALQRMIERLNGLNPSRLGVASLEGVDPMSNIG